jgi:type IV pilus assembly protein PilN
MIRINLLGEKKDKTPVYVLQFLLFGFCVLVTLGVCFEHYQGRVSETDSLQRRRTFLESQASRLREKTKAVDALEKNKKLLAEKLITIARLKAKKQGPVRVLDDLTVTIPDRAWLTAVSQKGDEIEFRGIAMDNQTVSHFMESLEKSKYFHSVDLRVSKQYVKDTVKMQQFHVLAQLTNMLELNTGAEGKKKAEEKNK